MFVWVCRYAVSVWYVEVCHYLMSVLICWALSLSNVRFDMLGFVIIQCPFWYVGLCHYLMSVLISWALSLSNVYLICWALSLSNVCLICWALSLSNICWALSLSNVCYWSLSVWRLLYVISRQCGLGAIFEGIRKIVVSLHKSLAVTIGA